MTISTRPSAPLFVVVGATGTQGQSIIHALSESPNEYRVRAITRDPNKPAAQELKKQGCELVAGDLDDPASIAQAFRGAQIVFGMTTTDYWSSDGEEKERNRGRMMAETAKKNGTNIFIWSGLPSLEKLSAGKHHVWSFEVKHDITQYARSLGGMRVIDVQPGIFASNFTELQPPIKVSENEYILPLAYDADTQLPVVDMSADYGRYALGALEHGVDTLLAAGEVVTPVRIAEVLSKVSGKNVTFVPTPDEKMYEATKEGGEVFAKDMVAMAAAMRDWKKFGTDIGPSQRVLSSPARTFEESVWANKALIMDKLS